MNLKIKNLGRSYWVLQIESEDPNLDKRVLASISDYSGNKRYCITDFRYSTAKLPFHGDSYANLQTLQATDKLKENFDKVFVEPKSFYENGNLCFESLPNFEYYCWNNCDGIVFAGADYPFKQQTKEILKHPMHIFSYKLAKQHLADAKNFWEYFKGTFEESKIENIYRLPNSFEILKRLESI